MSLRRTIVCALSLAVLTACAGGPTGRDVIAAARPGGRISFDVVDLTPSVLATVLDHQPPPFARRFPQYQPPPHLTLAVGDRVSVVIWEAAANGLFGNSLAQLSLRAGAAAALGIGQVPKLGGSTPLPAGLAPSLRELAPLYGITMPGAAGTGESPFAAAVAAGPAAALPGAAETAITGAPTGSGEVPLAFGLSTGGGAGLFGSQGRATHAGGAAGGEAPGAGIFVSPAVQQFLAIATENATPGTAIPNQPVGADGGISIPYAGRIAVAGRTPRQAATIIRKRLAALAIDPQVLVVVRRSDADTVAVTGNAVAGRLVPLSPGGERLLQVIAAAGRIRAPVRDTYVRLTRGGVTAGVPLATLIADPAQDIFARPGDVLTVERRPRTFSVFGATGRNTAITFDRDRLSLAEALGEAGGLADDRADAGAVFLFRYEPDRLVRALGQPVASNAPRGVSPIAYRLDLKRARALFLARRFPVHNNDVIFVANAATQSLYYFFQALQQLDGPIVSDLAICQSTNNC